MSSNNLLIVGLGNPDKDYEGSRHNCGADYVKFLSDRIKITLSKEDKFFALYGCKKIEKKNIHLCIPSVYVNESGQTQGIHRCIFFFSIFLHRIEQRTCLL
jgi:PTH1 family peptidyl-tRNA hydrolase